MESGEDGLDSVGLEETTCLAKSGQSEEEVADIVVKVEPTDYLFDDVKQEPI